MKIEQIYTNCLAEAAYYIESNGEVAIIDPLRDPSVYLEKAQQDNATIKYIFETHFHADFVSGHVELAEKTGATIVYGPPAQTHFKSHIAQDGEIFYIGNIQLRLLHTPGHTLESSCFLLIDETGKEHCIFTGDTLFIGDVGRPDLAIKSDCSQHDLAGMLYDSLHQKIMPLSDDIILYPAHGAGSACGKHMSKETFDTLGHQKKFNYALKPMSKEEFIKQVTTGLLAPPKYFAENAAINQSGAPSIEEVYAHSLHPLSPDEFEKAAVNAIILDTRSPQSFCQAFIPNSISIGLDGQFAPWVGALLDIHKSILLVCEEGREKEAVMRLSRVGYDKIIGYLQDGITVWKNAGKEIVSIPSITACDLENKIAQEKIEIVDVRKAGEYETDHLTAVVNKPLDFIDDWKDNLDTAKTFYIHCAGGYRSVIAASILWQNGVKNVINIEGGFAEIKKTTLKRESALVGLDS